MVPSLRSECRHHAAYRESLRRKQSPHRRVLLQRARSRLASGSDHRPARRTGDPVDQGRAGRLAVTTIAVVDGGSGNLRSAAKALERAASEACGGARIVVTDDPQEISRADRIVLPGQGAFADVRAGVAARPGLEAALVR